MKKRPVLIGIIPLWDSARDSFWLIPGYMDGLTREGALPVMLPLTPDTHLIENMAGHFDGFVLSGGQDVSPGFYGEPVREICGEMCEARDKMEIPLVKAAVAADKPIFGICRGLQLLNVALGGTLYQDIPSEFPSDIKHSQKPPYNVPLHEVELSGYMKKEIGEDKIEVNSYHHQGIKELSPKLEVCGRSPDGLVEAARMPDRSFVLAVQWHPEFALEWESSKKLFAAFVKACRRG